jgi:hypothetical protein
MLALAAWLIPYLRERAEQGSRHRLDLAVPQPNLTVYLDIEKGKPLAGAACVLVLNRVTQAPVRLKLPSQGSRLGAAHANVNLAKRAGSLKYTLLTLRTLDAAYALDLEEGRWLAPRGKIVDEVDGKEYFIGHLDEGGQGPRYTSQRELHRRQIDFRHSLTAAAPVGEADMHRLVAMASLSEGAWTSASVTRCRLTATGVWIGWLENPGWERHFEIRVEQRSGRLVLPDLWQH